MLTNNEDNKYEGKITLLNSKYAIKNLNSCHRAVLILKSNTTLPIDN